MPKYLFQASYTPEGLRGMIKEGIPARMAAVKQVIESVNGKLEAFYFAFGETDAYGIVDVPDSASAIAASLVINASGAVNLKTTVLISPDEMDAATKKSVTYRPPGG